jgi:hypothetical protein
MGRKKAWNGYLTDDDKFKMSKSEILRRKSLLISKNNILLVDSKMAIQKKKINNTLRKLQKYENFDTDVIAKSNFEFDDPTFQRPEITSLDLISDNNENNNHHSQDHDHDETNFSRHLTLKKSSNRKIYVANRVKTINTDFNDSSEDDTNNDEQINNKGISKSIKAFQATEFKYPIKKRFSNSNIQLPNLNLNKGFYLFFIYLLVFFKR